VGEEEEEATFQILFLALITVCHLAKPWLEDEAQVG